MVTDTVTTLVTSYTDSVTTQAITWIVFIIGMDIMPTLDTATVMAMVTVDMALVAMALETAVMVTEAMVTVAMEVKLVDMMVM